MTHRCSPDSLGIRSGGILGLYFSDTRIMGVHFLSPLESCLFACAVVDLT